jgi:N-acylneuraminate cytidylyltransferase
LKKSKEGNYTRRQDAPKVWEYNGAIYVINTHSLQSTLISQFEKVKKYVMDERCSVDIDTREDFERVRFFH